MYGIVPLEPQPASATRVISETISLFIVRYPIIHLLANKETAPLGRFDRYERTRALSEIKAVCGRRRCALVGRRKGAEPVEVFGKAQHARGLVLRVRDEVLLRVRRDHQQRHAEAQTV